MPAFAGGGRFTHSTSRASAKKDKGTGRGSDEINRFRAELLDEADEAEAEQKEEKENEKKAMKKKRLAEFKKGLRRKHSVLHGVDSAYIKYNHDGDIKSNATFGGMSDLLHEFEEQDKADEALERQQARQHEVRVGRHAPTPATPRRAASRHLLWRAAPRRATTPPRSPPSTANRQRRLSFLLLLPPPSSHPLSPQNKDGFQHLMRKFAQEKKRFDRQGEKNKKLKMHVENQIAQGVPRHEVQKGVKVVRRVSIGRRGSMMPLAPPEKTSAMFRCLNLMMDMALLPCYRRLLGCKKIFCTPIDPEQWRDNPIELGKRTSPRCHDAPRRRHAVAATTTPRRCHTDAAAISFARIS